MRPRTSKEYLLSLGIAGSLKALAEGFGACCLTSRECPDSGRRLQIRRSSEYCAQEAVPSILTAACHPPTHLLRCLSDPGTHSAVEAKIKWPDCRIKLTKMVPLMSKDVAQSLPLS